MNVDTCTCTHYTPLQTYVRTHAHTHTHTHIHTCTQTHAHTRTHMHTKIHEPHHCHIIGCGWGNYSILYTYICICMSSSLHTFICLYIYLCTKIHTHPSQRVPGRFVAVSCSVLQWFVVCCSVAYKDHFCAITNQVTFSKLRNRTLQYIATFCHSLQLNATHHNTLHHTYHTPGDWGEEVIDFEV